MMLIYTVKSLLFFFYAVWDKNSQQGNTITGKQGGKSSRVSHQHASLYYRADNII